MTHLREWVGFLAGADAGKVSTPGARTTVRVLRRANLDQQARTSYHPQREPRNKLASACALVCSVDTRRAPSALQRHASAAVHVSPKDLPANHAKAPNRTPTERYPTYLHRN